MKYIVGGIFLFLIMSSSAFAYDTAPIWPRVDAVYDFCDDPDRQSPPDDWTQFDGKPADEDVLALSEGMYRTDNGGLVYVFKEGFYDFYLHPEERSIKKMTADHEMTFFPDKPVAFIGCSFPQLSEFLRVYDDEILQDSRIDIEAIEQLKNKVENESVAE